MSTAVLYVHPQYPEVTDNRQRVIFTLAQVLCRQCQYAVRPNGIVKHLAHSNHRISASDSRRVEEAVQEWEDIEADIQQLQLPQSVRQHIKGLAISTDGLLCIVAPDCEYVCRSKGEHSQTLAHCPQLIPAPIRWRHPASGSRDCQRKYRTCYGAGHMSTAFSPPIQVLIIPRYAFLPAR